ncbi:MFS transporter [Trichlorobacter ammonificans]|uniref:MFS family arabinose efflux permease n=1 Tax=Trichlorobacter ammonificans TaxID=2916410 RepID=A0ABN8HDP4_9BACT|nr:MFS transporter [Trichlorobacter ammonificans]CAH2030942.1 Putative MFS family arabinose efflux permease [Trichlorobacter ammonificans]
MYVFLRDNRNFRNFWLGQVASQIGDRVHTLAVIWLVYTWTRSGTALGLVLIAATLPSVLVSPWAGYLADRFDRRKIAIAADLIRCLLVLALALLASTGTLEMTGLVIMTALISLASAFFNPATLAMLPAIVPAADLARANAITQLSANASGALGFLAGSGLIALIGVPAAFLCNGVSFVVSALLLASIAYAQAGGAGHPSFLVNLREGWTVVRGIPVVARLLAPLVVINFLFSSLSVLIPVFGEGVFRSGSAGVGLLLAAFTCGMFLAALALSSWHPAASLSRLMTASLLLVGGSFLLMGLFAAMPLFLGALALTGFALNGVNICLITLFQRMVPGEVRGKFFSLLTAVSLSAQPISFGLTGWLSDLVSPAVILSACGLALLVCAAFVARIGELRDQYV